MLSKAIFKKLNEYLKKYEGPWLTDNNADDDVPKLGGYLDSRSEEPDRIALDAFLKNKKIFSQILMDAIRILDQKKGIEHKYSDFYKKAFVSKQVFSSIFNGGLPSKDTVFLFAFALEASVEEAEALLKHAGYSFGDCIARDLILKFCFAEKITEILEINELLKYKKERVFEKHTISPSNSKAKHHIEQMEKLYNRKSKNLVVLE
jgi:hypothetical protein